MSTSHPAAPSTTPAEAAEPENAAEQPEPVEPAGADPESETPVAEVPLNRAERRARAKGALPSHVGPQAGRTAPGSTGRSHSKRQIG